jgi:hypothetical protein
MTPKGCCAGVLGACLASAAFAQTPPAGGEFQINGYTTGNQYFPSVAMDDNGNFIVAWEGSSIDGSDRAAVVRRFNSAGAPLGPDFVVNAYTTGRQGRPGVASDSRGGFVVTWDSSGQDGSSYGVRGRRFDAQGNPVGNGFAVNTYTTGYQWNPRIAANPDGRFAIVWESIGEDGDGSGVFARIYDESGTALGPGFQVNVDTTGNQAWPDVALDGVGNVKMVYHSQAADNSDYGIMFQRYNYSGSQAGRFVVNTFTTGYQKYPSIAVKRSGAFVVVWMSANGEGNGSSGIRARIFDDLQIPLGNDFQVNTYSTGTQGRPSVAIDDAGNFVVTWLSYGQDGSSNGVFGQQFDAAGNKVGNEFRVNTYTTGFQAAPTVAASVDGDFVVAWAGPSSQPDSYGITGQRYGDLIFQDNFESADLSRWSSNVTDGGDLHASGSAALAGTGSGLLAFVDDTQALYVQDDTPANEGRYRARFYLDPNTFDPGEGSGHVRVRVFIAFNASSQRLVTIVLRRIAGAYSVMGRIRKDDGTRQDTGFFAISNAPHWVELDWQKASGPGTLDSHFELRIDDAVVSSLTGIDNDALGGVDFARLGLMVVKPGASGWLYFDQFESRRQRLIGAEWP